MNTKDDLHPLREILHRMLVRYLTVRPQGFVLNPEEQPRATADARIVGVGGARTLYRARRPVCRSLDGVQSTNRAARLCGECPDQRHCTPQVRLDLVIERRPYRLLLANTSARAFLTYDADLKARGISIEHRVHRLEVANRGNWGELRFALAD